MTDPYLFTGPTVVSFSGGRTSGYMLRKVLDAYQGVLPADVFVIFANTGKERPETLDFVERCSQEWGVPIVWLEYYWTGAGHGTREVNYATASRKGEPFEHLLIHHAVYRRLQKTMPPVLPNPVQRFCTSELKIRRMRDWMKGRGYKTWTNVVGLRADEPRRVARSRGQRERWDNAHPLAKAGVTEADVMGFWRRQPFDLQLEQHEGNCDLCFLKSTRKMVAIMRSRPDLAAWWADQEQWAGAKFRIDRPDVVALSRMALDAATPAFGDESLAECACTD